LQGIYDFDKDSSTQYKECAVDAPEEYFGQVADDWENIYHGKPPLSKLESVVKEHCPRYVALLAQHLRFRTR
jgi:hypothetical protein